MMRRNLSRLAIWSASFLVAVSCSAVSIEAPQYFTLSAIELETSGPKLPHVLRVASFDVAPHLSGEKLRARSSSSRIATRDLERWSAPLGALVTHAVGDGLLTAGRFHAVVEDRNASRADLVLEGRVVDFEEFRDAANRHAFVALALVLRAEDSGRVLLQRRVEAKVPLYGEDGASLVAGLHDALGTAFRSFLVHAEERAGAWSAPNHE